LASLSASEELSEYLARIKWIDVRDRDDAVWEKGMFANQNVVAKLRQPFTLQRLAEHFDLESSRECRDHRPGRCTSQGLTIRRRAFERGSRCASGDFR
jgi:hypothetical protein